MNYRLGALGFLSGPTFQEDGTANAGLHDQHFALEWVQKHIHLFGGDKSRVTVFGESAGGGSIMHQITAYGGRKAPVPFAQALPQSPGWTPLVSNQQQEQTYKDFLNYANVTDLAAARELSSAQVMLANAQQVGAADYGQFVYGPTVDGDFVPTLPGVALLHGQFPKNLKIMVGHNANEVRPVENYRAGICTDIRAGSPLHVSIRFRRRIFHKLLANRAPLSSRSALSKRLHHARTVPCGRVPRPDRARSSAHFRGYIHL